MKKFFIPIIIINLIIITIFLYKTFSLNVEFAIEKLQGDILRIDEEAYGSNHFDSSNLDLKPILDETVKKESNNVIYMEFVIGGNFQNNIQNIIYDIAFVDLELDCELLSPYLKWRLIKNKTKIFEGSFDYQFDTIQNGRLLLTNIQQDLKPYSEDKKNYDHYQLYIWLSDACQSDNIIDCINNINDQSNLLNKKIKGKVEVELYASEKKKHIRKPSNILLTDTCVVKEKEENGKEY